MTVRFFVKGFK